MIFFGRGRRRGGRYRRGSYDRYDGDYYDRPSYRRRYGGSWYDGRYDDDPYDDDRGYRRHNDELPSARAERAGASSTRKNGIRELADRLDALSQRLEARLQDQASGFNPSTE